MVYGTVGNVADVAFGASFCWESVLEFRVANLVVVLTLEFKQEYSGSRLRLFRAGVEEVSGRLGF